MTLRGSLADLPLPDLLQIVSVNRKTGRLRLTTAQGEALIVFRLGKIVYAASNAHRESFGSALLLRGLVTSEQLLEALDRKARAAEEKRLGSILVEMGLVTEAALGDVLRDQLREVMAEVFRWRQGVVEFEEMELEPRGEVAVDSQDFVMRDGVSASGVLLALVDARKPTLSTSESFLAGLGWSFGDPPASASPAAGPVTGSLSGIMEQFPTPAWPGETVLEILSAGMDVVSRGVLLMRSADGFRGLGQFGVWPDSRAERVRALRLPLRSESFLSDVARTRRPFRGVPDHRPHSMLFFRFLDSDPPASVVLLPVAVNGEVQLMFYGDNHPRRGAIGDTSKLERFLAQVGQAMA